MKVKTIRRIENPSIEEFRQEFLKKNQPVIISGVANHWPAYQKWNPEFFKQNFGHILAPMRTSDNEIEWFFGGEKLKRSAISIAEYFDLVESVSLDKKRPPYLGNIAFNDPLAKPHLDRIRSDIQFPNYFPKYYQLDLRLWISALGQKSTIHNDNYHNFNAQIYGEKAFLLFSPEQYEALYPVKINDELWSSPINPQQPELEKYPQFEEAIALEGILKEAEILFLPMFWWHQFRSITTSINVNMWVELDKIVPMYEKSRYCPKNQKTV
ncbi:transcription factor jumonji jmjC domain protein (plasmid) [Gloeothece citriformis PCC 7424]|uniref:Transcription factor jumonji jmjC domain protein n=1 Tax=Gloeothece citriformis (strain PCC 7424) TaxID=65393 RepID=B7KM04_GLOC7|nr:cupin-like domain-containing protein [Gloeothece citriformis]ACK73826.1 transcription factor jumonji jmjC domain protein [Gloeothece citriformis PCC 7424]